MGAATGRHDSIILEILGEIISPFKSMAVFSWTSMGPVFTFLLFLLVSFDAFSTSPLYLQCVQMQSLSIVRAASNLNRGGTGD